MAMEKEGGVFVKGYREGAGEEGKEHCLG